MLSNLFNFPKWSIWLISLIAGMVILNFIGIKLTGFLIPVAILTVAGILLYCFLMGSYDKRPSDWRKSCSLLMGIFPDDSIWEYFIYKYNFTYIFVLVMAAIGMSVFILFFAGLF